VVEHEVRVESWNYRTILLFAAIGMVFLVLQTTIGIWAGPSGHGPEFLIVLVIFLGLRAPLTRGAILSAGFGFFRDAAAGGIFGLSAGIFFVIFLVTHRARQRLDPTAPWYLAIFIFLTTLAAGGLSLLMLHLFGWGPPLWSLSYYGPAASLIKSSLFTTLVGLPLFWACRLIATRPEERPEQKT
jgi:rod shape-determining protein MreD